jgi:hypothetical protein
MVREVGWPNGKDCGMKGIPASAYPTTICWKPHRVPEEDELNNLDDLNSPSDNPPVSHRRTISEVTARPEREQEDDEERSAQRQAIGQEGGEQPAQAIGQEDGEQPAQAIGQEGGEQPAQAISMEDGEQEPRERPTRASGRRRAAPRRLDDEI